MSIRGWIRYGAFAAGVAATGAGASALPSCSGETSFVLAPIDAGAPSTRNREVCSAWAERECTREEGCFVTLFLAWQSHTQCVDRLTLTCELLGDDPDVSFDAGAVASCAQRPTSCGGGAGTLSPPSTPALCLKGGHAPAGAPCVWDYDCANLFCVYTGYESSCGHCEQLTTCSCPKGSACVATDGGVAADGGFTCVKIPGPGEPCGPPLDGCLGNSVCVDDGSGKKTCVAVPQAGLGEACSLELPGPICSSPDADLYCADSRCRAYHGAGYGEACARPDDERVCTGAGRCDGNGTGACLPPAPDGVPCDNAQFLYCLPPAYCANHTCVFPSFASCGPPPPEAQ